MKKNKKTKEASLNIAEDHALVVKIKEGNQGAFNTLYKKYKDKINFHLLKLTKGNVELAKDLGSETFMNIFNRIKRFNQDKAAVSTWMFTIARNCFIDHFRKDKHEVISIETMYSDNTEEDTSTFEFRCSQPDVEKLMISEERKRFVREAVQSLENLDMKYLVELRYFEELSYEEVAEKTGFPIGTVKAMLFRARGIFKEKVKESELFV